MELADRFNYRRASINATVGGLFEDESFTSGVRRRIGRCIGVDLYSRSVDSRNDALMKNPNVRRYMDYPNANPLFGGPNIGEKYSVSENLGEFRENLDKFGGLLGYTFDIGFGGAGFRYKGNEATYRNMENLIVNEIQAYSEISFNPDFMLYRVPIGFTRNTSYVSKNPVRNVNDAEEILGRLERFEGWGTEDVGYEGFGFGPDVQRTRQRLYTAIGNAKNGKEDYLGKVAYEDAFAVVGFDNDGNERERNYSYYALKSIDNAVFNDKWGEKQWTRLFNPLDREMITLYDEYENGIEHTDFNSVDVSQNIFLAGRSVKELNEQKGLLDKTNYLFSQGKINSLVNRFHTNSSLKESQKGTVAFDVEYGYSRGRNLRALTKDDPNGYENPYCRVWTSHHQYSKIKNLIRPFMNDNGKGNELATFENIQGKYGNFRPNEGQKRLDAMSSLQKNGFVSIAPHVKPEGGYNDDVKRCMFSLENLAWKNIGFKQGKDVRVDGSSTINVLGEDQKGPNGGKIMWFPPYNLKFNESTNVNWEGSSFIGRGEQVYTYNNTDRKGTLSFTLLIDHPSVVSRWAAEHAKEDGQARREQELRLLRFFAGCDTTDPNDKGEDDGEGKKPTEQYLAKWDVDAGKEKEEPKAEPQEEKPEPKIEPKTPVSTPEPEAEEEEYRCYVFFPNNLSGYDYLPDGKDAQVVVDYLLKGGNGNTGYEMKKDTPINGCIGQSTITGKNGIWKYEVDRGMDNEEVPPVDEYLKVPSNYQDSTSFMLNSDIKGVVKGGNGSILRALLSLPQDGANGWDDDRCEKFLISFSDFAVKSSGGKIGFLEKYYNDEKRRKYTVKFELTGHASSHGRKNGKLAMSRADFLQKLLVDNGFPKSNEVIEIHPFKVIDVGEEKSVSAFKPKVSRSVEIVIKLTPKFEQTPTLPEVIDEESGKILERNVQEILDRSENNKNTNTEQTQNNIAEGDKKTEIKEYHNNPMQEYEYFNIIDKDDPAVRQRIIDKVRYFDPAFHSISPEGFNARLTFLQQCTRQGPTTTMSDNRGAEKFAGNMAFGRPPVCVLRIGDFFNTKIIIDSLSIDYDNGGGTQWDLNPEGIGVQPMMANVNIGFTFLGGSDISGPIERLQNAVSSNFYANTSIYDPKADYRNNPIEPNNPTFKAYDPQIIVGADNTRHFDYNSNN